MKKSMKILMIVMAVLIVGLVAYIVVDKCVLSKKESTNLIANNDTTGQVSNIESSQNITENSIVNNSTNEASSNGATKSSNNSNNYQVDQNVVILNSEKKVVKELTSGSAKYVCIEYEPTITGIDSAIAKKIQDALRASDEETWNSVNEENSDSYVMEILNNASGDDYEIGFYQKTSVVYNYGNIVTFFRVFDGGIGGVSWYTSSGISFDIKTGETIDMDKALKDKDKFISVCEESAYNQLQNDSRKELVQVSDQEAKEMINSQVEQLGGWFTSEGYVCTNISKYVMAAGSAGEFQFTIKYEDIDDYLNADYLYH